MDTRKLIESYKNSKTTIPQIDSPSKVNSRTILKAFESGFFTPTTKFSGNDINKWNKQVETISNKAYNYLSNTGYKKADPELLKSIEDLLSQSDDVRQYILYNRPRINDYQTVYDGFRTTEDYLKKLRDNVRDSNDYFSTFPDAKTYEESAKYLDTMQNTNTTKLAEEIKGLEVQSAMADEAIGTMDKLWVGATREDGGISENYRETSMFNTIYNEMLEQGHSEKEAYRLAEEEFQKRYAELNSKKIQGLARYKTLDELNADLSSKKKILKEVTNYQEVMKLSKEARNSTDFNEFSLKGAKTKEATDANGKKHKNKLLEAKENNESFFYVGGGMDYGQSKFTYKLFTEDEKKVYNYYFGKGDFEAADRYWKVMKKSLNERYGKAIFNSIEGTPAEYLYFIPAGLDQFATGIKNVFNFSDEYVPASSIAVGSSLVREDLGEKHGTLGTTLYDIGTTTVNMIPSIATGAAVGAAVGTVNPVLGAKISAATTATLMGASAKGNAYVEKINAGWSVAEAQKYSTIVGVSEACLQYALNGVSVGAGALTKNVTQNALNGIKSGFLKGLAKLGISMGSEAIEEGLQEILDPFYENFALGYAENGIEDIDWEQVAYSAVLGGLSGALFEGGGTAANTIRLNMQYGRVYSPYAQEVVNGAREATKGGDGLVIVEKAQETLDSGKKLSGNTLRKLIVATNEGIAQSNVAKLSPVVSEQLMAHGEQGDVAAMADIISRASQGLEAKSSELKAIENSHAARTVFADIVKNESWVKDLGLQKASDLSYNQKIYGNKNASVDSGNNQGYNNTNTDSENGGAVNAQINQGRSEKTGNWGNPSFSEATRGSKDSWTEDKAEFVNRSKSYKRAGKQKVVVENSNSAFAYIPAEPDNSVAYKAVKFLQGLGINVIYCDGGMESNKNGKTETHPEAVTAPDGTIYVNKNSTLSAIAIAVHEGTHHFLKQNSSEYAEYRAIIDGNIDVSSESFIEIAVLINEKNFNSEYTIDDENFYPAFIEELAAYVNEYIVSDYALAEEKFAPMFSNWEAVVEASRKFNEAIGLDFSDVDISGTNTEAADNSSVNGYNNTNTDSENGGFGNENVTPYSEERGQGRNTGERSGVLQTNLGRNYDQGRTTRPESGRSSPIRSGEGGRNRSITPEQTESLKSSAIKNADGSPKAVYHFTDNMEFDVFAKGDIGFHFGNETQAAARGNIQNKTGRTITAYLDIKNPINISTDIMSWRPRNLALKLLSDGIVTVDQYRNIVKMDSTDTYMYNDPAAVELRRILSEKGYDGIVYQNMFEGDGESYIAFYPEQVIIIDDGKGSSSVLQSNAKEAADDTLAHPAPTAGKVLKMTPVSAKAKNYVKAIGEALGWKVEFGPVRTPKGGKADGKINRNTKTLTIDPTSEKPIEFIFKHELAHILEQDKGAYADLQNAIMDSKAFKDYVKSLGFETVSAYNADIVARYRTEGVKGFDSATAEYKANCEMVANFVGDCLFGGNNEVTAKLLEGMNTVQRRSFAQWVKDFFAKLKDKLSGKSKQLTDEISELENAFLKVLNSVGQKENTAETDGESYSIATDSKNRKVVVLDRNIFKGVADLKARAEALEDWIIKCFGGTKHNTSDYFFVVMNERTAGKMKFWNENMDAVAYERKLSAAEHIDELIKISKFDRYSKNVKDKHKAFADKGWNYFKSYFTDGERIYEADISVAKSKEQSVVYNIGYIKDVGKYEPNNKSSYSLTGSPNESVTIPASEASNRNSTDRISQKDQSVNSNSMQENEDYSNSSTFAEQEDTVDTDDESYAINHFAISDIDTEKNMQELAKMDSVYTVKSEKLEKTGKKPSELFSDFFDSLGNSIYVEQFGDIALSKSSVKSEIRHGITAEKIASIEAIPTVLKQGKIIFAERKSGSDVDRIVVGAPIKIGEKPYYMGVMLQRDSQNQRLYLHNVIIEEEMSNTSQADLLTTGALEDNEHLSMTNILQKALSVKNKYMQDTENYSISSALAEQEDTVDTDDESYSLQGYSQHQIDNWSTSKNIVVYKNEQQLRQFVRDALKNQNLSKKIYFGSISKDLAARIKRDTGIDVEKYNCTLRASEIKKIIKDHGNEEKEYLRGQRKITEDDFVLIPTIIQQPDEIVLSDDLFEGKPVINFIKTVNGKTTVTAYVSAKHLDLTVQTMYSGKNKGNLAIAAGDQAPANTPEANAGTVPNNSISNSNENVNYSISAPSKVEDVLTRFKNGEITQDEADKLLYNSISGSGDTHYGEHIHHTPSDYKPTSDREWQVFCRSFANQTNGMKDGKYRAVSIFTADAHYLISADGYMSGVIVDKVSIDEYKERKEFYDNIPGADVSDIGNEENGSGQRNHGNSDITSKNEGADSFDVELDAFIDSHPEWFANKRKARSDSSRKIKETAESDESYSVSTSSAEDLLTRYEKGEISREEYLEAVSRKKTQTPYEIAHLKPEDAEVTSGKGNPKREGKGDRESRFYASALGSEIITPEIKAEIEKDTYIKNYQGTTNKRTLSIAAKELSEGGQERAQAFKELAHTPEKASAVDVAVGFILLEGYQRVGNEAAALETAEILAKIGTGAGQTVQLFSIMGRFTPETMIAYVQKDLDKAYEKLVELKSEKWAKNYKDRMNLTEEDIEFIRRRTLQAAMLEDGTRPKEILLAEIVARATDKIPPENGQSLRALQRVSLLLNVRTQLRNVVGNANMVPIFVASDFFGSLLDRQLAKTSGVRTTGNFKFKGRGEAFVRGLAESYDDFKRGIRTRREELNRYDVNGGAGKNFNEHHKKLKQLDGVSRALNKMDNFTSFCLEAGDRSFFEMWFTNSINNQLRLNKTDIPTEDMIEIAREEALQRTWQDNNVVTRSMSQLKKNLNNIRIGKTTYGFGDFVLKFVKTPANIGKAMVEFSPVGFAMATAKGVRYSEALQTGKLTAQMQKELVRSMSNAFTGTVLYALVAVLASLGVIELSGGGDEDKDVSNFEKYIVGVQPYSVKIFGVDVTYSWNQPMGTVLATVADFMESKKDGNDALWYEDVWNAFKTGATVFTEQSFLSSLYELFSADDMMTGISEAALSEPAAFIPQIVSQTASFTDPYRRTTYESGKPIQSAINSIIYKIPGLRQALPEQVNVMGETVENNQYLNPWKAFIDPSTSYGESSGAVAEEIYKLYKATGDKTVMPRTAPNDLSIEKKKIVFSAEEKADFQRTIGEKSCEILKELFNSEEYKALSDAKKAKAVAEVYEYAYAKAKAELDIYDYEMLSKIVGTKSNGEAILTKEVYDRLDKKARQRLIDEEFLSKLEIKCNDDPELLAKVFVLKVME